MSETLVIVNRLVNLDHGEEAFASYTELNPHYVKDRVKEAQDKLTNYLIPLKAEQRESALQEFLGEVAQLSNAVRIPWAFSVLHHIVEKNMWPARLVCETILECEKLDFAYEHFWNASFGLILRIMNSVDYKGVREIMKGCCDKFATIPSVISASQMTQVNSIESVMKAIFVRENCLLPGYFVINEILKPHFEKKGWPHWVSVKVFRRYLQLAKKVTGLISKFVEDFRLTAQMVSIIGQNQMLPVVEHNGCSDYSMLPWRLDPVTLKFNLKGNIPYEPLLLEPQIRLLRYVLEQPYSRDMVCSMLGLQKANKNHCPALEEQLVELLISAMEAVENGDVEDNDDSYWIWSHLSSQLIYFVLFQFAVFPNIVFALLEKLKERKLQKGRDHLMWALLQYISGSIQRKPLDHFMPVLQLYDLLYTETEPMPLPDTTVSSCTHDMAVACIWIHLICKAQAEKSSLNRAVPVALTVYNEFLQVQASNSNLSINGDYRITLLCNAFSTNNEYLSRPMAALVDAVGVPSQRTANPQSGSTPTDNPSLPTVPLSMSVLDSLTIHAKMSLIHSIVTHVIKMAASKSNAALAPALVETYSRLLVYTEIESLGIKGFISQLLPTVFKSNAWGILYTLLEMFSYRMHHIQPHYRVQLLSHLQSLNSAPQTNHTQLHLCVENTALRLVTGLNSNEVQPQLSRYITEPKTLVSVESEELNRALVLTIARAMHITGSGQDAQSGAWCREILNTIMQNTPHNWASHTAACFPPYLAEYFQQNQVPKENKQQLKKAVEEEYRNWTSMTNENDIIAHFSVPGTPPLFLCLLWKMILETDTINPIAYKILERIGARALSSHLRKFCDYLVFKFAISEEGSHVNKCVDAINSMIWKYNIVTIDRLTLCLALRTQEGSEAQVCFFIIQLLLFKGAEFRARVQDFVKDNSPEHWKQSNWHEKHVAFHRQYPENFATAEIDPTDNNGGSTAPMQNLPVYCGNICLRFLPVFDIVIHRYLELPPVSKSLETLLDHLGCLYKFHDRPVTYLYNTLHYYEKKLSQRPLLKRKLVCAILSPFCGRTAGWSLTEQYINYTKEPENKEPNVAVPNSLQWVPNLDYYVGIIRRLADMMSGKTKFLSADWRFNEFPNCSVYGLYITCVELMALPCTQARVTDSLVNVVVNGYASIPTDEISLWCSCIGMVMAALPESHWLVLQDRLAQIYKSAQLCDWKYGRTPFEMFNFALVNSAMLGNKFAYILAVTHAVWHHAGAGHLAGLPLFLKEKLVPHTKSEEQLLFLCHLIGPFLSRYNVDRPSPSILDIVIELFNAIKLVDNNSQRELKYQDQVCDLLYHIKYQYVGNLMKTEVEGVIQTLRPSWQKRLRFIAQVNVAEVPPN